MQASTENPVYSVFVVSGTTKYNITGAVESLDWDEPEKQIAAKATIDLMNIKVGSSQLYNLINEIDRVFIYANDGTRNEEVFRGFVWTKAYKKTTTDRTLQLKCYDNMIYFQESEESEYFSSGNSTKTVMSTICKKWGVSLSYNYESITHSKLVLRGNLADIFTSDILDTVKDRTGKKYVIRSVKDVMQVNTVGSNTTIYTIKDGANAISSEIVKSMDGVVTRVKILGKADKSDRKPVAATVNGNTSKYGTLQKLIDKDENTSLANAKKEAQNIINEDGKPTIDYNIKTTDIPWIRKGDLVKVQSGAADKTLLVIGISHSISAKEKTMDLTLEEQ